MHDVAYMQRRRRYTKPPNAWCCIYATYPKLIFFTIAGFGFMPTMKPT